MLKRHLPLLLYISCSSNAVQADFIGLHTDASNWFYHGSSLSQRSNLESDFSTDNALQLSIAFEHPFPLLPNSKIKYSQLSGTANYNPTTLAADHTELTQSNYLLYYEILDTMINLDLGIGLTHLSGQMNFFTPSTIEQYQLSSNVGALYLQASMQLPFTGLSTKTELTFSQSSDVTVKDLQAEIQYDFLRKSYLVDLGGKLGYRYMTVDLDFSEQNKVKQEFKGPYLGLNLHF